MKFKGEKAEIAKELHNYFKQKICSGDYVVTEKGKYVWVVMVDDCYRFSLWIANGPSSFKTYAIGDLESGSFMDLHFTLTEQKRAWSKIRKQINQYDEQVLKAARREKYEELKSEFEGDNPK